MSRVRVAVVEERLFYLFLISVFNLCLFPVLDGRFFLSTPSANLVSRSLSLLRKGS